MHSNCSKIGFAQFSNSFWADDFADNHKGKITSENSEELKRGAHIDFI